MGSDHGFRWRGTGGGEVRVTRGGLIVVLRGPAAGAFLADVAGLKEGGEEAQQACARVTLNDRRGNERTACDHPRNRGVH